MWTDEQIKELAKKHGWWAVESWWQQAIPRFRAMLEEYAAQQSVQLTGLMCPACGGTFVKVNSCSQCGLTEAPSN